MVKRGFLWAECCLRERVRVRFPAQGDMLLTMALCRGTPRMPSAAGMRPSLALGAVSSAQRGTFLTTAPAGGDLLSSEIPSGTESLRTISLQPKPGVLAAPAFTRVLTVLNQLCSVSATLYLKEVNRHSLP